MAALHRALDRPIPGTVGAVDPQVAQLLKASQFGSQDIDRLYGAYVGGALASVALAVASPGSAALVFVPSDPPGETGLSATVDALCAVRDRSLGDGIKLLEVLTDRDAVRLSGALSSAGFFRLTRLVYLLRGCDVSPPTGDLQRRLEWVTYSPSRRSLFEEAIVQTYAQSLDCPELTRTRSIEEVVDGHRATGGFDPDLWSVATRDGCPVGVCLLNRVLGQSALEIVYMGVSPGARGTGVGDAMLARTLGRARESGVMAVALAVDERNGPARGLYARWGFVGVDVRDAWIASSVGCEG